jgi:hypothetical protein
MARMAGNIGSILAVGLLGCTQICQMALDDRAIGLNLAYQTTGSDRGQTGCRGPRAPGPREQLAGPGSQEALPAEEIPRDRGSSDASQPGPRDVTFSWEAPVRPGSGGDVPLARCSGGRSG